MKNMNKINLNELKTQIESGLNYSQLAENFSCNERTIERYAKKLGLNVKTKITKRNDPVILEKIKMLVNSGKTNSEIAKELSISPTTVRRYTKDLLGKDTNSVKTKSIKDVCLTDEQLEIIYGSLLGDMSISKTKNLARLSISQGGNHESYFDFVCSKFEGLLGKVSKEPRFDNRTKKWYNKFIVRFLAHNRYLDMYKLIYKNGVKTITQEWLDKLTPRSIAYWFMDDGSRNGDFATNCFTLQEIELCQKWFKDKFNIDTRIRKVTNKEQWLLFICVESRQTFDNLIKPYMHESMLYKLKYRV